jgi:DNA-directed RNA polymerase I, II, and III subunit RPABC2
MSKKNNTTKKVDNKLVNNNQNIDNDNINKLFVNNKTSLKNNLLNDNNIETENKIIDTEDKTIIDNDNNDSDFSVNKDDDNDDDNNEEEDNNEDENNEDEEDNNDEEINEEDEIKIEKKIPITLNEKEDCIIDDFDDMVNIKDVKILIVDKNERITLDRITKYEYVRILGIRTKQIENGAKIMIKYNGDLTPVEIAEIEIKQKKSPIIIKRILPSGKCELWKLSELNMDYID